MVCNLLVNETVITKKKRKNDGAALVLDGDTLINTVVLNDCRGTCKKKPWYYIGHFCCCCKTLLVHEQ